MSRRSTDSRSVDTRRPFHLWDIKGLAGLLLATLLTTGCASLTPPPGQRMNLSYAPLEATAPTPAEGPSKEHPRILASSPSQPELEAPGRPHRRRGSHRAAAKADAGGVVEVAESVVPRDAAELARPHATQARQALFVAVVDVSGSMRHISGELSRLKASRTGIGGRYAGMFRPFVEYGAQQLRWIDAELAAATRLSNTASEVADLEM